MAAKKKTATKKQAPKKCGLPDATITEMRSVDIDAYIEEGHHPWCDGFRIKLEGNKDGKHGDATLSYGCHNWRSKKDAEANYIWSKDKPPVSRDSREVREYAREVIDWADAQFKRAGIKW